MPSSQTCFRTAALLLCLFAVFELRGAEDTAVPTIFLTDPTLRPTATFGLPTDPEKPFEILFGSKVPQNFAGYESWGIDVADVVNGRAYQTRVAGLIQNPVRWDGFFGPGDRVRPNRQYKVRLTLYYPGNRLHESPWVPFSTVVRFEDLNKVAEDTVLSAYIIPSGTMFYQGLSSPGVVSVKFPVLSGQVTGALFDKHRLTMRFETSSHLVTHLEPSSTAYYYSDISFFYAYRLIGTNPRHRESFFRPKYAGKDPKALEGLPPLYAPRTVTPYNLDLGVRAYYTIFRGFGGKLIDSELARAFQGFSFTAEGEMEWRRFLFKASTDVGYSFLQGSILQFGAQASAVYNALDYLAPGIQLRYQMFLGTAADDPNDGVLGGPVTGVSNQVVMAGLHVQFKL